MISSTVDYQHVYEKFKKIFQRSDSPRVNTYFYIMTFLNCYEVLLGQISSYLGLLDLLDSRGYPNTSFFSMNIRK